MAPAGPHASMPRPGSATRLPGGQGLGRPRSVMGSMGAPEGAELGGETPCGCLAPHGCLSGIHSSRHLRQLPPSWVALGSLPAATKLPSTRTVRTAPGSLQVGVLLSSQPGEAPSLGQAPVPGRPPPPLLPSTPMASGSCCGAQASRGLARGGSAAWSPHSAAPEGLRCRGPAARRPLLFDPHGAGRETCVPKVKSLGQV